MKISTVLITQVIKTDYTDISTRLVFNKVSCVFKPGQV